MSDKLAIHPLYDYHTGNHITDYVFEGEPQNGDMIQPGGVGSSTYTIIRCWENGQVVIKLISNDDKEWFDELRMDHIERMS